MSLRFSPDNLKKAMEEEGLSQAQLARIMGVSRASVSRVLAGRRSPGSKFVGQLKQAFPALPLEAFFESGGPGDTKRC